MNHQPILVTCGLPYTNGRCHLGHLRTYVPADFFVRFLRRTGQEVVFICGSDNHGTPIVVSAEEEGILPRDLSLRYHKHFDETFKQLSINFDHFGMTDGEVNHRRTRSIVQRLIDKGYVYKKTIQQSYCAKCCRFLPDRYVEGNCPYCGVSARGDECDQGCGRHLEPGEIKNPRCRVCGQSAELREQEHYYFKLSEFRDFLLSYLPDLGGTVIARNYAIGWVKEELHDWCITRTLDWGVRFPGAEHLVVYVWVDAPIGYISFTEEWAEKTGEDWKAFWCGDIAPVTHFIGSDIIYHHTIFWPAMLKGAGYGVPEAIVASGMLKVNDQKFSKSRGYVVWTGEDYLEKGMSPDYLRYYLLSYTNHTKDLNFAWKVFQERMNNEVVGTLGNFIYRTLYFAYKFFGQIPETSPDETISAEIQRSIDRIETSVRAYEFKSAVDELMALAAYGNSYIQNNAPWQVVKTDRQAAETIIRTCLQIVHALTLLLEPVMPVSAQKVWSMLGNNDDVGTHRFSEALDPLPPRTLPAPQPPFQKIEDENVRELEATLQARVEAAQMKAKSREEVSIEDFGKIDIRVGTITSAVPVKGSKKLLKLQVHVGEEERQIVGGIAEFYSAEELVGKEVVVVLNLKPVKIFGIESRGMILAAGDQASLLVPLRPVEPGTKVR
ncbi:MAG: methionine--tRNA ligase [Methanomicrobiales archaeon]|nr:methionine--tRNA ligase [Methanomicrobiales archaeon]